MRTGATAGKAVLTHKEAWSCQPVRDTSALGDVVDFNADVAGGQNLPVCSLDDDPHRLTVRPHQTQTGCRSRKMLTPPREESQNHWKELFPFGRQLILVPFPITSLAIGHLPQHPELHQLSQALRSRGLRQSRVLNERIKAAVAVKSLSKQHERCA